MKYLKIKNKGLIEPQALTLIGASSKVDDNSKIGMFGSGNKYALAYIVRNNIEIKIYSGRDEIKLTTITENFRNEDFEILCVNDEKTSITTAMGKDWELWQAIREIYCNAIDEGKSSVELKENIYPIEDETHFYIGVNKEIEEFMVNFDNYFTSKKKLIHENEYGRIYEKSSDTVNIYRKGIRCWESKENSFYDYDFNDIRINESRIAKYDWNVYEKLFQLMVTCNDKKVIMNMLRSMSKENHVEQLNNQNSSLYTHSVSEEFKELIFILKLAPREMGGLCTEEEKNTFLFIPERVYNKIEQWMDENNKAMAFSFTANGKFYTPIKVNKLQQAILNRAEEFFNACDYKINYKIEVVSFNNKKIMGMAENNKIYVSDLAIEKGVSDLCNTIIEEQIHLRYDCIDESREFQTAAINELITYMKKSSAFAM